MRVGIPAKKEYRIHWYRHKTLDEPVANKHLYSHHHASYGHEQADLHISPRERNVYGCASSATAYVHMSMHALCGEFRAVYAMQMCMWHIRIHKLNPHN